MSVEGYRQRAAAMCDAALRHMIYEEFDQYQPEAMDAAQAELKLRNRDIFELGGGDTVTLRELIDRLDFDECIAVLKELDKKADGAFYNELLVRLSQTEPGQDSGVLIHYVKSKAVGGGIEVFGTGTTGNARFNIELFHYNEWLAAHIKKEYILVNGRELAVALCLIKMTEVGSDEAEIDSYINDVKELTQRIAAEDEDENDETSEPGLLPSHKAADAYFTTGGLTQGAKHMRAEVEEEIEYMSADADGAGVPQVRPFVRFCARFIDETVFSLTVVLLIYFSRGFFYFLMRFQYIPVIALIWVLIEAVLLSTWGTTLGKWLLMVKVRNSDGEKLRFSQALFRSFLVKLCGECFQMAYMEYALNIFSYFYLHKRGKTLWDESGGFTVTHERIGVTRVALSVFLIIAATAATLYAVWLCITLGILSTGSYNITSWLGLRF